MSYYNREEKDIEITSEEQHDCPVCKKVRSFASSESPKGFWICPECGYRTSFGKMGKLVETQFGYKFDLPEEFPLKIKVIQKPVEEVINYAK